MVNCGALKQVKCGYKYCVQIAAVVTPGVSNVLTATSAVSDKQPELLLGPSRPQATLRHGMCVFTCFGFRLARCGACGAGAGRNLGAGAAVGVFLHVCFLAVSGAEAELRAESRRALWHQTEKRRRKTGCSECGSGDEGPDSFLSNAETPSRRHLDNKTNPRKKKRHDFGVSSYGGCWKRGRKLATRGQDPQNLRFFFSIRKTMCPNKGVKCFPKARKRDNLKFLTKKNIRYHELALMATGRQTGTSETRMFLIVPACKSVW